MLRAIILSPFSALSCMITHIQWRMIAKEKAV